MIQDKEPGPEAGGPPEVTAGKEGSDWLWAEGRALLLAFHGALRALRLHPMSNQEARNSLATLGEAATSILEAFGELEIRVVRQSIFVNRLKLGSDIDNFVAYKNVLRALHGAKVGVVRVEGTPSKREWHVFLALLLAIQKNDMRKVGAAELQRQLTSRGVENLSVSPRVKGESVFPDEVQRRTAAKKTYVQSVEVSKKLFKGARMGRSTNVKQIKHAVISIVDQVLHNEASLGGLSTLKDYDDYSFTHSVNVCIFCVAIGRRLGLSKRQLYDLGLAALVHDLGMSRIPVSILTKEAKLTPEEERAMQAHTWLGALSVFSLRDFGEVPYQSMVAAYEHHMKVDLSGYPRVVRKREPSVFSKIIAVAAAFDAATNTRVYSAARPPDEVLRELWEEKDLGFDPVIVKALINLLGIYPVGTCVILDTFELGLVHAPNPDPTFVHRPMVRVLSNPEGMWLDPPPLADLADTDGEGTFLRSIIKVSDPEKYGVKVSEYFV